MAKYQQVGVIKNAHEDISQNTYSKATASYTSRDKYSIYDYITDCEKWQKQGDLKL